MASSMAVWPKRLLGNRRPIRLQVGRQLRAKEGKAVRVQHSTSRRCNNRICAIARDLDRLLLQSDGPVKLLCALRSAGQPARKSLAAAKYQSDDRTLDSNSTTFFPLKIFPRSSSSLLYSRRSSRSSRRIHRMMMTIRMRFLFLVLAAVAA